MSDSTVSDIRSFEDTSTHLLNFWAISLPLLSGNLKPVNERTDVDIFLRA